jgi:cell division protein ZapA
MAGNKETIHISVLGKEFAVSCPEDEREALAKAARYVDLRMQEGQRGGRTVNIERHAVMAALNMAYELLRLREQSVSTSGEWVKRVELLTDKVERVLRDELKERP